jgi:hypothetical protein
MLDVFLAVDCGEDVFVSFDVDQPMQTVMAGETIDQPILVLGNATANVARDADIQRSVGTIGHDVDPTGRHAAQCGTWRVNKSWVAGPSPARTQ